MEAQALELVESESLSTLEQARAVTVVTADDYVRAGEFIVNCKSLLAKIKAEFAEPKRKAHEAHKSIVAMEERTLKPVQDAVNVVSGVALDWKREQDRLAKIEHDRQEAERRAAAEAQKLKEAEVLEQWGEDEAAAQKLREAITPTRPIGFVSPAPRVEGLSSRKAWKVRVINPSAVNRQFCEPNMVSINAKVKNHFSFVKPTAENIAALCAEIGGVEVYEEEVYAGKVRA